MLQTSWIIDNKDEFIAAMKNRNIADPLSLFKTIKSYDELIRVKKQNIELKNKRKKEIAKLVKQIKNTSEPLVVEALKNEGRMISDEIFDLNVDINNYEVKLLSILLELPNIPLETVPIGKSEADNIVIENFGNIPQFSFSAKDHVDIGIDLGMMDFETAASISGSRFVILSGQLARLQRALENFMLDTHINYGFEEIDTPLLVRKSALVGTGQLPKFSEDLYHCDDEELFLIPTAEVSLTNIANNRILEKNNLPMRFVASTPCFRQEEGAAGGDTRGMIRQHQFKKVELVSVVSDDDPLDEFEFVVNCAKSILDMLKLPYRVVELCTSDLGFSSKKTYDLEVYLPSQNGFKEISSISYCGDFQARRMNARYKENGVKGTTFVHTINGSGLAVGRCLVAILENYQQEDGSIIIPECLRGYMGGLTYIGKK